MRVNIIEDNRYTTKREQYIERAKIIVIKYIDYILAKRKMKMFDRLMALNA